MSGNSSGDKSEKPTASKLQKARDKGDIPRSKDVTMAAGLVASLFTVPFFFPYYQQLIQDSFESMTDIAMRLEDEGAMGQFMLTNVLIVMKFLATLLPIPAASIIASLVPGGWIFVLQRIKPDIKKISPIAGVKRLFSGQHLVDVLKMIAKCCILLGLLYLMINSNLPELIGLQTLFLQESIFHGLALWYSIISLFVVTIALFAFIDIPLSKHLFTKKMKMSKKDVREEYKNQEGNPQIKGRIRQLQRQIAMGQINSQVPQADVVITNPTHFAVALKYDPAKAAAPYIVAKGVDDIALYIRSVAEKHLVEVVEFPPLARSIYHSTRVNQQIPASLFRAMAHVLTYVMQLKSWRAGAGDKPQLDRQISIPKEDVKTHGKV
ncbi:flagellar biosynthesis protein FlhB [Pantoea sp. B65]|uniref:flagellar biosynthesis protein FlhB n=1 Tax=Pantoea sp. B65 TaxID=2813359 RepID=UPI0039B5B227